MLPLAATPITFFVEVIAFPAKDLAVLAVGPKESAAALALKRLNNRPRCSTRDSRLQLRENGFPEFFTRSPSTQARLLCPL